MTRALVVGDVMLDVVTRPSGPVAPTSDTPASTRVGRGGSSSNVAVALAEAGVAVVHVGAAGRDAAADVAAADLAAHGVATRWERHDGPTGVVVAVIGADGQRAMLTDRGVNPRLTGAHVAAALGEGVDHLHLSGYTLLDPETRGLGSGALEHARSLGMTTSVDACSAAPLRAVTPRAFLAAMGAVTYLFANEEEAAILGVDDGPNDSLFGHADELVVTRGPRGAVAFVGGARVSVDARAGDVLDTTGAGDAAIGSYLGARLRGEGVESALAGAMDAAARAVGSLGAL